MFNAMDLFPYTVNVGIGIAAVMADLFGMKITGVQIEPIIKSIAVEGDVLEGYCTMGDIVCIQSEGETIRAKVKAVSVKGGKPSVDSAISKGQHGALALEDIKGDTKISKTLSSPMYC